MTVAARDRFASRAEGTYIVVRREARAKVWRGAVLVAALILGGCLSWPGRPAR
jgi:hypothetical protein